MEKAKFNLKAAMQQLNVKMEQRKVELTTILRDQPPPKDFLFSPPVCEDPQLSFFEELSMEKFWQAYKSLAELSGTMTKEETVFYSRLIVEQARNSDPSNLGNAWLAEACYKEGNLLRQHLSDSEFAYVVNAGFWEFAKVYFKEHHGVMYTDRAKSRYNMLINSEFVDLSRVEEFRKKVGLDAPLPRNYYGWPDYAYLKAFNDAKPKIKDKAIAAWIAHPIIDQILSDILSSQKNLDSKKNLKDLDLCKKELESYKNLFAEPVLQTLFKNRISGRLDLLRFDAESVGPFITFVRQYLTDSEGQLLDFINLHLPWDAPYLPRHLIDSSFPRDLLSKDALDKLQKRILADLNEKLQKDELSSYVTLASKAMLCGFLEPDVGKGHLHSALEEHYLSCKKRPSGDAVFYLLDSLNVDVLGADLCIMVVKKGIEDLELRHRHKAAEEWRKRLGIAETPHEKTPNKGPLDRFVTV